MTAQPFRAGHAVLWIRPDAFRAGRIHPATVARVTSQRVTLRLLDGRQRTTLTKMLAFGGYCPSCELPAIVANGRRVCPACDAPAESLPPLALAEKWHGGYHLRSRIVDTLMRAGR